MTYIIKLRLRDWKNDNIKNNWDFIISCIPPCYRAGYNHNYIATELFKGGTLEVDFPNEEVADQFMLDIIKYKSAIFDIQKSVLKNVFIKL